MIMTQAIFGVNVAVFLAMTLSIGPSMLSGPTGQELVNWGANYGPYTVSGQWWRLLTCVFVHGSLLHIAFNMWCLWDLGRLAESIYGRWTFTVVYLLCGISSSLLSLAWHFPVPVPSVGASGAIFGIAGALLASFYLGEFSLPRAAVMGTMRSVAVFVGYNLFFGAVMGHIDNAAHIGGLVLGLLLGAMIAKFAPSHDAVLQRVGIMLVGAVIIGGSILYLKESRGYVTHINNGVSFLGEGKTDEAIVELKKVVAQRPNFAAGHEALARAYISKRDYPDAAVEMKRVIALDPHNERAYDGLGLIYLQENQLPLAQDTFAQMIKVNPNNPDGHSGLASALSEQRKDREALEEFKRAAAIDGDYQGIYYNIGVEEARLGLLDDAIASLVKQRQYADDQENEKLLADVYTGKGMLKEAAEAKQKAQQLEGQK
jgi:rhomboid protease GluP